MNFKSRCIVRLVVPIVDANIGAEISWSLSIRASILRWRSFNFL